MAFQREIEIDKERVTSFLKNALNKVMTEENPDLLNDLKKIFKRTIPFSKRMYVAAYLTKEMQGKFHGAPNARRNDIFMHGVRGGRNFKDASYGRPSYNDRRGNGESLSDELRAEAHTPHPRVQIDESLAATIFISIGRNRRVYPRDLVGLLVSVAGLDRDRIGDIRVLANYSFVQLFKDDTEKVFPAKETTHLKTAETYIPPMTCTIRCKRPKTRKPTPLRKRPLRTKSLLPLLHTRVKTKMRKATATSFDRIAFVKVVFIWKH